MTETTTRRSVVVDKQIIGPPPPRPRMVRQMKRSDFPHVSAAHLDVAEKLGSPLMMGPPLCEELVRLVEHLFTEEEARFARHLGLFVPRSARDVAAKEHGPAEEADPVLRRLAFEKFAIISQGEVNNCRYRLLPIMPGIFELVLVNQSPETLTDWHRRFAELFEALYETGYIKDYTRHRVPLVRFLPVAKSLGGHPLALPSDRLEVVLDRYDTFAIGNCQCRIATQVVGRGCGRPTDNCAAFGEFARTAIFHGAMKRISKKAMLDVKMEAEALGMVNWIMNIDSAQGQFCCSCCGCCCHAMRIVREHNVPSSFAVPHFTPEIDEEKCTFCGLCAKRCPMGALVVDSKQKTVLWLKERCIGCGQCVLACEKSKAVSMKPVPEYRLPPNSWFAFITRSLPNTVRNAVSAWLGR